MACPSAHPTHAALLAQMEASHGIVDSAVHGSAASTVMRHNPHEGPCAEGNGVHLHRACPVLARPGELGYGWGRRQVGRDHVL
jgi:hypothetical protein